MFTKLKRIFSKNTQKTKFINQYQALVQLQNNSKKRFDLDKTNFHPCLDDDTVNTGFDRHYIYHPAWAARIIKNNNPSKHIDISSTLHFCSILSAFIPVDFYDYRPANLHLDNLKSLEGNLTSLPFESGTVESISCMHTVEHVGLGRYGDPLQYDGDILAINELKRVLKVGGSLLFVVPLGAKDIICFNAHRIYSKKQVLDLFSDLKLREFSFIPEFEEDGGIIKDPSDTLLDTQFYGCGCFWFTK